MDYIFTVFILAVTFIVVPLIVKSSRRIHMRHSSNVCRLGHSRKSIYKMIPVGSATSLFFRYHSFIFRDCETCGLELVNDAEKDFFCVDVWWRMIFHREQFDLSDEDLFYRAGVLEKPVEPLRKRIAEYREFSRCKNVRQAHDDQIQRLKFSRRAPSSAGFCARSASNKR